MNKQIETMSFIRFFRKHEEMICVVLAFGIPFVVYLLTLAPTVYNLDSAELTTAAATLGLTRATGYPLYILLGHLFSLLPFGDVGFRLNLFSAFNGALTIALTFGVLRRLKVSAWASLGALGLLAFSTFFWALSLIAEVYTLHTALTAGVILALLKWKEEQTPKNLGLLSFLIGISFTNHMSTVLLLPGYLWYVAVNWNFKEIKARAVLFAISGFLLGISLYVYLPIRYLMSPVFNYAGYYDAGGSFITFNLTRWDDFFWLVSGKGFWGSMFEYHDLGLWYQILQFIKQLWEAFVGVGVLPGLVGVFVLLKTDKKIGIMTLLMFFVHTLFYIGYEIGDRELMFLPSYLVWTLWVCCGYQWLLDLLSELYGQTQKKHKSFNLETIFQFTIMGLVIFSFVWKLPVVDQSDNWSTRELGETILDNVEQSALILGYWDIVPVVEYLQIVEGKRVDIKAINRFLISPESMTKLIVGKVDERPIYIDSPLIDLPPDLSYQFDDPLYQIVKVNK